MIDKTMIVLVMILLGSAYLLVQHERENLQQYAPYQGVDLGIGYNWSIGDGYVLSVQAITINPKKIWLKLYKNGEKIDDKVLNEGDTYNYQNKVKTNISKIYVGKNSDRVILIDSTLDAS